MFFIFLFFLNSAFASQPYIIQGEETDFGKLIAIDNNTLLINSLYSAHVFEKKEQWISQDKLIPAEFISTLIKSLTIFNKTAAISVNNAIYIFERQNAWYQTAKLTTEDKSIISFGDNILLYKNTLIISIYGIDKQHYAGVYIFEKNTQGKWIKQQQIIKQGDYPLQITLALDENTLAMGVLEKNTYNSYGASDLSAYHKVYVYEKKEQWQEIAALKIEKSSFFAASIAMEKNIMVIGAPNKNALSDSEYSSAAYVFRKNNKGKWLQSAKLIPFDNKYQSISNFGQSIDINNKIIVIAADKNIYFFQKDSFDSWLVQGKISQNSEGYGYKVVLKDNNLLISSIKEKKIEVYNAINLVQQQALENMQLLEQQQQQIIVQNQAYKKAEQAQQTKEKQQQNLEIAQQKYSDQQQKLQKYKYNEKQQYLQNNKEFIEIMHLGEIILISFIVFIFTFFIKIKYLKYFPVVVLFTFIIPINFYFYTVDALPPWLTYFPNLFLIVITLGFDAVAYIPELISQSSITGFAYAILLDERPYITFALEYYDLQKLLVYSFELILILFLIYFPLSEHIRSIASDSIIYLFGKRENTITKTLLIQYHDFYHKNNNIFTRLIAIFLVAGPFLYFYGGAEYGFAFAELNLERTPTTLLSLTLFLLISSLLSSLLITYLSGVIDGIMILFHKNPLMTYIDDIFVIILTILIAFMLENTIFNAIIILVIALSQHSIQKIYYFMQEKDLDRSEF